MKKNIRIVWIILLISILGVQVGNAQNESVKSFPTTYSASFDSVMIPPVLLHENKMIVTGNKLVSVSVYSDTLFRVFSLPDCEYLGAFGQKGNGPGEFNRVSLTSIRASSNGFFVKDLKYFREIELPDRRVSDNTIEQRIVKRSEGTMLVLNQSIRLNDSITLGTLLSSSPKELALYNYNKHDYDFLIDFPKDYKRVPDKVKPFFYIKDLDISPDKSKLVYTYRYIPKIRIVDLQSSSIICEKKLDFGPEQIGIEFTENSFSMEGILIYYFGIISTADYFYAFYRLGEVRRNEGVNWLPRCELHKFDWKGDPIAKIPLPQWATNLAVADDDSKIYFVNLNIEDRIYFMNLNGNMIDE